MQQLLLEFLIQLNFRVTKKLTHVQKRNKETKKQRDKLSYTQKGSDLVRDSHTDRLVTSRHWRHHFVLASGWMIAPVPHAAIELLGRRSGRTSFRCSVIYRSKDAVFSPAWQQQRNDLWIRKLDNQDQGMFLSTSNFRLQNENV